jgi:hypothetical protein
MIEDTCLLILFKQAKCYALEAAESEHTLHLYQKKLAAEKQHITALLDKIHEAKEKLLEVEHDTEARYFQHTQHTVFVNSNHITYSLPLKQKYNATGYRH